jgi:uncharacterized membrane protein YgcG
MKKQYTIIAGLLLTALLSAAPAWATQTARPGSLNYVEGQVSVANQPVDAKSIGSVELEPGQSLVTGAGKAELLLTPGVFFRVGDNSSTRMISPNLTDTEVELVHGNALVEVTDLYRENDLRVIEDGKSTQLVKNGLYDFDADHDQFRVFDGQAVIQDGNKQVKVKGGHEVNFNDEPLKTQKFDKKSLESSDLYRWTSLRSSYLAEANVDAARTYVVGGPGWFGYGWYWDPWFSAYTFIPGDGIFYSPFGWGYYSPGLVWGAPFFYGGHYFHHFAGDYRAWGPGYHYGFPYHYGNGVRYGARPAPGASASRGGGASHGFSGGGFSGGGFHGGGGFHR